MRLSLLNFKRGLLLFWAAWSTLVFASNLSDALQQLDILGPGFGFVSGNYDAVVSVVQLYSWPVALGSLMFAGVLMWDAINSFLFWRAALDRRFVTLRDYIKADRAFIVALTMWGAMMLADEFFLSYRVASFEGTHRGIFTAMLVSFLAVRLLPDA